MKYEIGKDCLDPDAKRITIMEHGEVLEFLDEVEELSIQSKQDDLLNSGHLQPEDI